MKRSNKKLISLRFMIPIFIPVLYMAVDFLFDQKELSEKFMETAKKRRNKELKELSTYNYELGLQVLRRWERQIPECVKLYYLGKAPRPTTEEITEGFQRFRDEKKREKRLMKLVKIGVYLTILILTLLAIFL